MIIVKGTKIWARDAFYLLRTDNYRSIHFVREYTQIWARSSAGRAPPLHGLSLRERRRPRVQIPTSPFEWNENGRVGRKFMQNFRVDESVIARIHPLKSGKLFPLPTSRIIKSSHVDESTITWVCPIIRYRLIRCDSPKITYPIHSMNERKLGSYDFNWRVRWSITDPLLMFMRPCIDRV